MLLPIDEIACRLADEEGANFIKNRSEMAIILDMASISCGSHLLKYVYDRLTSAMLQQSGNVRESHSVDDIVLAVDTRKGKVKYTLLWSIPAVLVSFRRKTWAILLACADRMYLRSQLGDELRKGYQVIPVALFVHRVTASLTNWIALFITGYSVRGKNITIDMFSPYATGIGGFGITCKRRAFQPITIAGTKVKTFITPLRIYPSIHDVRRILNMMLGFENIPEGEIVNPHALEEVASSLGSIRRSDTISCMSRLGC